jgi:hypothetical protein
MAQRRWFDPSQPQTLQAAVMLSYFNAALAVIYALLLGGGLVLILLVEGIAANGIANDQRWGYWLGVGVAALYLILQIIGFITFSQSFSYVLNMLFAGMLLALLLHPMSRAYQRIWFH